MCAYVSLTLELGMQKAMQPNDGILVKTMTNACLSMHIGRLFDVTNTSTMPRCHELAN